MKITVLSSSTAHPLHGYLEDWVQRTGEQHDVDLIQSKSELSNGDILFLISCCEIIGAEDRDAYASSLVLHASDLPFGRGWSPHIWEIVDGASEITVSLLEAQEKVDSGYIWQKITVDIPANALWDEINHILFTTELRLMDFAIENFGTIAPQPQNPKITPSYYVKRSPKDSKIDPEKSIKEQFDLIRVCDPDRFPAFFELKGARYALKLEKIDEK